MTLPNTETQLTAEQIAQIEAAKKIIPKLKEQIRKAQSAGIDVGQQQTDLAALEQQLDKLYRVYVRKSAIPGSTY
jgi:activator of 2-hydroxyglutaryl-CoA dehydratase